SAIVAALTMNLFDFKSIIVAAIARFLVAVPVAWVVAKNLSAAYGAFQERPHRRLEHPRALGVEPVPRTRNPGEFRIWKQVLDPFPVFRPDIVRQGPREEEGGAVEAPLGAGPAGDPVHLALQHVEVEPPSGRVGLEVERLEEEGPHAGVLHGRGKAAVGLRSRGKVPEVEPAH